MAPTIKKYILNNINGISMPDTNVQPALKAFFISFLISKSIKIHAINPNQKKIKLYLVININPAIRPFRKKCLYDKSAFLKYLIRQYILIIKNGKVNSSAVPPDVKANEVQIKTANVGKINRLYFLFERIDIIL